MKKLIFLAFSFLVFAFRANAQDRGKVEVVADPLLDTLIAKRSSLRPTALTNTKSSEVVTAAPFSGNGYRVQIFSGPNRSDAYAAQTRVQNKYPGMRTYISYTMPNFKVKAGDFRTRLEAERFKQELQSSFTGLFIIPEKINIPKAEPANDQRPDKGISRNNF